VTDSRSRLDPERLEAALAIVTSVLPSGEPDGTAQHLECVCSAAVNSLRLLGATVRLLPPGGSAGVTVAARDTPQELTDIEFEVGEGPGATCYASGTPVLVPDLAGPVGNSWPGFRQVAVERGVAAVFAFPLLVGGEVSLGTLELFSAEPGPLTPDQTGLARAFAEIGVGVLLDGHLINADGGLSHGLERSFEQRADIAQAQGMVTVDLGVSLTEAMARLRAHSFAIGLSLSELAGKVIGGYRLPADDGNTGTRGSSR
jgi:hypothetical protein